ncbi:hypothetical protein [Arthrobacter sp. HS15c]|uniref:hypothetical protein n=1 Tax=Arthrobacter sp. HS15c TaxID=3230279 RepID=UPI003466EDCC
MTSRHGRSGTVSEARSSEKAEESETDSYSLGDPILNTTHAVEGERYQHMWLRDMIRSLMRRWYVLLVCLLAAGVASYVVYQSVPVAYSAKGSLVLMPPRSTVGPDGNPYLFLGGMGQALDVLASKLSAEDNQAPILEAYPGVAYTAEPDRTSSGSVVLATVRGADGNQVMDALGSVVAAVPTTLAAMQESQSVPEDSRISLMTLVVDSQPTVDSKTRTVSVLVTAGGGVALGILLTGLIDGRLLARAGRLVATRQAARVSTRPSGKRSAKDIPRSGAVVAESDVLEASQERTPAKSKG